MDNKYKLVNDIDIDEDINLLKKILNSDIVLKRKHQRYDEYIINNYNVELYIHYNLDNLLELTCKRDEKLYSIMINILSKNNNIFIVDGGYRSIYKYFVIYFKTTYSFKNIDITTT